MTNELKIKQGQFPTIPILAVIWLCIVIGLTVGMVRYGIVPGNAEAPPNHWPQTSPVALANSGYTLLMFAYPKCPCTKASIGELEQLLTHAQMLTTYVVFIQPDGVASEWTETDLVNRVHHINDVRVVIDSGGLLAHLFDAETSGSTQLFDTYGTLRFKGGITLARGHAGDNPGRSAIEAIVHGTQPEVNQTPVFGCSLFDKSCPVEASL